MEEYKNNSLKAREAEESKQKPKQTSIVKGEVTKKETLRSKVMSTFIHEDRESVLEYAVMDVVVPMLKEAAMNLATGTLSMLFYGDASKASGKPNYSKVSTASYNNAGKRDYQGESNRSSTEGIILASRSDAVNVLNQMRDLITDYDRCTVADYYDLVGVSSNFTDNSFGWTNLDSAYISSTRGGFTIKLPTARRL